MTENIPILAAPTVTRPPASNYAQSNQSTYGASQAGLPPARNFYSKGKGKEDLSDLEGPDTRLQAGLESFPSRNNSNNAVAIRPSAKTATVTQGLGSVPKPPKPAFSVSSSGAVVMKRLDAALEKRFNKKGLPVVDIVIDPMISGRMRDHQKEYVVSVS